MNERMRELRRTSALAYAIGWLAMDLYEYYARCDEKGLTKTIKKINRAIDVCQKRIGNKAFIKAVGYLITEIAYHIMKGDLERVVSLMKRLRKTAMVVYRQKKEEIAKLKRMLQ